MPRLPSVPVVVPWVGVGLLRRRRSKKVSGVDHGALLCSFTRRRRRESFEQSWQMLPEGLWALCEFVAGWVGKVGY